jgi:hypothetical protein
MKSKLFRELLGGVLAVIGLVTLAACGGSARTTPAPLGRGFQALKPGIHVLDLVALETGPGPTHVPKIEITLPEGWFNTGGAFVGKGRELPHTVAVMFWNVAQVYPTPCKWKGKPMVDPGPGVNGLASALARQPLRAASVPTDVVLARFHGKYLKWSVPTDINFDHCDEGYFESWTAKGWVSDRYQQKPGQVDRIWILDVHGQRLVVDAFYLPKATPQDQAELQRVVDSIRFLD